MPNVTSAKTGNILQNLILCMILEVLLYHKDLVFVDKYLGHVNQQKIWGKARFW